MPIDAFFLSLAEDQGENAVCIVLSGTGTDGTLGLRAIKEQGGLTLAQSEYDDLAMSGMPRSAAATGLVDHVMPVEDMPALLIEYREHLIQVAAQKDGDGTRLDAAEHLATIASLLRARVGHDFSQYKPNTLVRRIQRRMQVLQIDTVPAFIQRLRQEPRQLDLLFHELLIGVTQFFRDPPDFAALQATAIPAILESKKDADSQVRIWVPGCATGEEVYSLAILLQEEMDRRQIAPKVQIFGTDIDDTAIVTARAGRYNRTMAGVTPERIGQWFVEEAESYRVVKPIREMCIFSVHNVIKDPPFSKLDLISCRNLLIYMGTDLQERVIRTFHYALRPGGMLFLGRSEGVTRNTALFAQPDPKVRLFERRDTPTPARLPDYRAAAATPATVRLPAHGIAESEDRIDKSVRSALEKHSPVYLVINDRHDILRFSGGEAGRYLEPAGGAASLTLFGMLRKSLRPSVRAAVQKAFTERRAVVQEQIALKIDGEPRSVTVIVEPLSDAGRHLGLWVVAFRDLGRTVRSRGAKDAGDGGGAAVQALEDELLTTQSQLQAAIDEAETITEEMKSSGEEYLSVNEELQSSNEELETAKEEMQSINEELQTINAELASKNELLTRLNSDMQNLLESTQIATIFLDNDMRIKGFTPAMKDLFHLRDGDLTRPITDIVTRLSYGNLRDDVRNVLRDRGLIEREVQVSGEDATYIMRIRPYHTVDGVVDGVVITFVDISEHKRTEMMLREHAAIVEFAHDALVGLDLDGMVRSWNPAAEKLFGYSAATAIGVPLSLLAAAGCNDEQGNMLRQARAGQVAGPIETVCRCQNGTDAPVELTLMPIRSPDGTVVALAAEAQDISKRKHAEARRELLQHELNHRVKNTLANVQALAMETVRAAPTLDAFRETFLARLVCLSKTHTLLTRGEWEGAALRDVLEAELAPYRSEAHDRWTAKGAEIQLPPKLVLAFGMAFHELATNAAKYGAFSLPGGKVEVTWRNQSAGIGRRLHLSWVESGGPVVEKPAHKGFGSRLIAESLAFELGGDVRMDFEPAGLRCTFDVSLPSVEKDR
jgi:two-component system CheB/CheR fusion protein